MTTRVLPPYLAGLSMILRTFTFAIVLCLTLSANAASVQAQTLLNEDFSDLALGGSDGGLWSTTDPSGGFELYNTAGGFSARAMPTTYGGDGSLVPAGSTVPGGQEILNSSNDVTVSVAVEIPTDLGTDKDAVLTFWGGQRIESGFGGFERTVEIVNTTDGETLVPNTEVRFDNGQWRFNRYNLDLDESDAGDTLEVRFSDSAGNAARGLQLADLNLSVVNNFVTLLDEDFSDLALGGADGGVWSTTDPSGGFELYNTADGFSARGMEDTYGGDGSGLPLSTTIAGGMEILNTANDVTNTVEVELPELLDSSVSGLLSLWAGQRISGGFGGFERTIEIENVTDGRTLVPTTPLDFVNFDWEFNLIELDFLPSDAGDTLAIRFSDSAGNAARGLQLADLSLQVAVTPVGPIVPIPEPTTTACWSLLGMALMIRRSRAPSES